jgi:ankyrin repeat protein
MIEVLIQSGATTIDATDHMVATPLFVAASEGHVEAAETLLRLGSKSIDTCDWMARTPLHGIAGHNKPEGVELLIKYGSKLIDQPDIYGWTPLHCAVNGGHVETLKALVRLGAKSMDVANKKRYTALHYALFRPTLTFATTLVHLGANRNTQLTCRMYDDLIHVWENEIRAKRINAALDFIAAPLDENAACETRFEVYFAESLVWRLLFELERSSHISRQAQIILE